MTSRYTVYGNAGFDEKIDRDMALILNSVLEKIPENDIAAVILGGGYGRGEGGVVIDGNTMRLYNDYDLFIISDDISSAKIKRYQKALAVISIGLTEKIGIDVDFSLLKNRSQLKNTGFLMMWYELKMGHKVIYGNRNILDTLPEYDANSMPVSEAGRLMLNRGVGLLLAEKKIRGFSGRKEDLEFIERNIYKALMAAGDTYMITRGKYHYSYRKRYDMIDAFRNDDIIIKSGAFFELYKASIEYKLNPNSRPENLIILRELHQKTKTIFLNFYFYILSACFNKKIGASAELISLLSFRTAFRSGLKNLSKNIILNLKEVGIKNFSIRLLLKHPGFRLYLSLPYFLFEDMSISEKIPWILGLPDNASQDQKFMRFIKLWERFN
jgi:hypothetical protein